MIQKRIELLDFARGIALVAMTVFHFGFDLQLFGVKEPGYIDQLHWKYFARLIAGSFLFLTGFSLYLAHGSAIRWQSWKWRMVKILACAAAVTVATFFVFYEEYIFFGILHAIAFASLAGLLFMRLHFMIIALISISVFLIGQYGRTEVLDAPFWFWTGLSEMRPNSFDYVPVFPWFSAPLMGIALAKACTQMNWLTALAHPQLEQAPARFLKFIGQNSLIYYIVHQPIMIALLLSVLWLKGDVSFG